MATKTKENKKQEFTMTDAFSLWKKTSKYGNPYFSGKSVEGVYLKGFFNTNKKNPKEPDLRVYVENNYELNKEPLISMWCNVSEKSGKKYLTGKIGEHRVVGFINEKENSKAPYVRCYYSEDRQQKIETEYEPMPEIESDEPPF